MVMLKNRNTYYLGLLMVTIASILFGSMPLLIKRSLEAGVSVDLTMVYRMFFNWILCGVASVVSRQSMKASPKQLLSLAFFGIVGSGFTGMLLSLSYLHIPMSVATMCHFSFPVMVTISMALLFKEHCTPPRLIAIGCTVAGIGLLIAANGGLSNMVGIAIAIASGFAYCIYVVSLEKACFRSMNPIVIVSHICAFCFVFFLVKLILSGGTFLILRVSQWLPLFINSLGISLAMVLFSRGVRIIGSTAASFINMLELITNLIVDMLVYAAFPSAIGWLGFVFILISVIFVALPGKRQLSKT